MKSLALLYKYVSAVRFGRRQQHFLYSYSAANHFCRIRGRHNKDRRSTLPSRLPGFVLIIRIAAPPSFFPLFYSTNHHHTQMCNDHTITTPHTSCTLNRCIISSFFFHNSHFLFKLDLSYTRISGRSRRVSHAGAA